MEIKVNDYQLNKILAAYITAHAFEKSDKHMGTYTITENFSKILKAIEEEDKEKYENNREDIEKNS